MKENYSGRNTGVGCHFLLQNIKGSKFGWSLVLVEIHLLIMPSKRDIRNNFLSLYITSPMPQQVRNLPTMQETQEM